MKTKLALAALLCGLGMTASAVSLNWSAIGSSAAIRGLTSGTAMTVGANSETASMTVYYFDYSDYDTIIGLGKVDASALSSYVVASAAGQTSTSSGAAGRAKASSANTDYTTAGNSFFARAYATFDEKTYFIDLFAGAGSGGVWTMTQSGDESAKESLTWSAPSSGTWGGATSTAVGTKNAWVAVPEPSSAALALWRC